MSRLEIGLLAPEVPVLASQLRSSSQPHPLPPPGGTYRGAEGAQVRLTHLAKACPQLRESGKALRTLRL